MVGTEVTRKPPVILIWRANQLQEMEAGDAVEEVVSEEALTKYVADKAYV